MNENNRIFPEIDRKIVNRDTLLAKYQFCYPVLMQCLRNELEGKKIFNLPEIREAKSVGLYALNEFMEYMIENLKDSDMEIRLYDKGYEAYACGYRGYEVNSYEQALSDYHEGLIEKIVICNLTHGITIVNDFLHDGVSGKDIRLVDMLVYGMGNL